MSSSAITAKDLHVKLGGYKVLHGISLSVSKGQWTCIVGPNGAGKSTLLMALAGLLPSHGELWVNDRPLRAMQAKERARGLAWLGQQEPGSDDLSVWDVVMLGRLPHQSTWSGISAEDHDCVNAWLDRLQLTHLKNRTLQQLSGGERQRVLLARALAVQAPIVLMDEPIANVDIPHQSDWLRTVRQLTAQHTTVVSVLHDLNLALRADHVVVMDQGRIRMQATPDNPQLHQALIEVFQQRMTMAQVAGQWVVLPL
jgi:iron complex transport system ATP-binding protein